ncbi:MAG: cytochrome P450 [Myxococcales bacterium]|nr:cytochrome P450 [Myxococcales bacterium]
MTDPATLAGPPLPELRGLTRYGNLLRFMADPDAFVGRCAALGDMVRLRMPGDSPVLLRHPALIEQVLVTKNRSFIKDRLTHGLREVIGDGLLVSEGELWRRQRRMAQPAFHRERILRHADAVVAAGQRATATWREGQVIDVHAAMMDLAREVVATTLLSSEVGRAAEDLGAALEVLMGRYSDWRYAVLPGLAKLRVLPQNRRFAEARARLTALVDGIIAERRRSGVDRGDLLSQLLAARDVDGTQMSDTQLRDEVAILFMAGHETTALALSWAFVLLGRRPGAWARLGAELDAVLGDRPASAADLGRLPYTEAVILETMRLYPPAWSIGREATEPVEIGGVTLATGTQVWMFQWDIQTSSWSSFLLLRPLAGGDFPCLAGFGVALSSEFLYDSHTRGVSPSAPGRGVAILAESCPPAWSDQGRPPALRPRGSSRVMSSASAMA